MEIEARELNAHIWEREDDDHYVEPAWCSKRLFEVEEFSGHIYDPACGFGTIPLEAEKAGYHCEASDKVYRGYGKELNFFTPFRHPIDNVVTNPPFNIAASFALRALKLTAKKIAIIFPVARLNAAHWIKGTPLRRIWLLTPRPSMPPGYVIARGEKASGGKMDYCWLVWEQVYEGEPELKWLRRDG